MASMGMVLTIGILITLLCSLIVLPSLVSRMHRFDHGLEPDAQSAA
jgi:predicted RND superfamily exporter protein